MDKQRVKKAVPALLYVSTGIVTAVPVGFAMLAAGSMGGPVSAWEYVSLAGSLALIVCAVISLFDRKAAARLALAGAAAVWSMYAPTIWGLAKMRLTDQRISLAILLRTPGNSPLVIKQRDLPKNEPDSGLAQSVIEQLKGTGLLGAVSVYEINHYGAGTLSHVTIVMEEPITSRVQLREPDANDLVYIQHGNTFTMFPANARTLSRTINLQPMPEDPKQIEVMVELASGARQGFGVAFLPSFFAEGAR